MSAVAFDQGLTRVGIVEVFVLRGAAFGSREIGNKHVGESTEGLSSACG
jgi:hypothetical protein